MDCDDGMGCVVVDSMEYAKIAAYTSLQEWNSFLLKLQSQDKTCPYLTWNTPFLLPGHCYRSIVERYEGHMVENGPKGADLGWEVTAVNTTMVMMLC